MTTRCDHKVQKEINSSIQHKNYIDNINTNIYYIQCIKVQTRTRRWCKYGEPWLLLLHAVAGVETII